MAAILIRGLSTLLATVTWSLAAGGLDKREMNNISASSEFKIATILNDGGDVYPSGRLDSHQATRQNESTLPEGISTEKSSPFAQQQPDQPNVETSFSIDRSAEALSPSMTSSSASFHLYSEFDKRHNKSISQLANNDLDISSTMFASDKNEYLPQISTSVFPSILSSSASLLDSYAASAINSTTATFFPQLNSTALSLLASSNSSHNNNEVGVNATDPFAFTTESRIMGLPIGIQVSQMHLFSRPDRNFHYIIMERKPPGQDLYSCILLETT